MTTDKWLQRLNGNPTDWLLKSNPWTKYRALTDLLEYTADSKLVSQCKKDLLKHELIVNLIAETSDWMPKAATRNSDPQISYFKLRMLADFGISSEDKGINGIYKKATAHSQDGMFACKGQLPQKLKKEEKFEKPDVYADTWHISPCNSPIITYAFVAMGYQTEPVITSVESLKRLWDSRIGWFCHFFFVDGQFKKVNQGCPIAGIMALDVFSVVPELKESQYAKHAYAPIEFHKQYGQTLYYFGRSKNFWTFKYPFVWYNGLYLADVLSRFDFLKRSPVLRECIDWILANQDKNGRFKPTSMFMPYKNWDFGNKKEPSPWITFLCCRILKRYFG